MNEVLDNKEVWEKFCYFFRNVKGYSDWSDDEIELSRNDDDFKDFVIWLCK